MQVSLLAFAVGVARAQDQGCQGWLTTQSGSPNPNFDSVVINLINGAGEIVSKTNPHPNGYYFLPIVGQPLSDWNVRAGGSEFRFEPDTKSILECNGDVNFNMMDVVAQEPEPQIEEVAPDPQMESPAQPQETPPRQDDDTPGHELLEDPPNSQATGHAIEEVEEEVDNAEPESVTTENIAENPKETEEIPQKKEEEKDQNSAHVFSASAMSEDVSAAFMIIQTMFILFVATVFIGYMNDLHNHKLVKNFFDGIVDRCSAEVKTPRGEVASPVPARKKSGSKK